MNTHQHTGNQERRKADRRSPHPNSEYKGRERRKGRRRAAQKPVKNFHQIPHPGMSAALKLDRRIRCMDTGETWPTAHAMWRQHPEWMTSSQEDRLTATLYAAAKQGERTTVEINGRKFRLVSVAGKAAARPTAKRTRKSTKQ